MTNNRFSLPRSLATLLAACVLLALAGCATVSEPDPADPLEGYNRSMESFNETVDGALLKPVATAYSNAVPQLVQTGFGNFFSHLGDAWSLVNNVLQGKTEGALHSFWRVVINTTIGLGGVLDPATEMRLERHREDFGQTLGHWGFGPGPYVVLPFFGPSTVRDTLALPVDLLGYPLRYVHDIPVRNSLVVTRYIDLRAQLLGVDDLLSETALDPYSFKRDAFLQKRRNDVYDGNPPAEEEERWDLDE